MPSYLEGRALHSPCLSVCLRPPSLEHPLLASRSGSPPRSSSSNLYLLYFHTRKSVFYVPCFLFALSRRPSVRIVQPSLMLSNLLTFSFHTISSLSLSSLSSLTSFSFFLLHPVVTPVQAGSLSSLSLSVAAINVTRT